MKSFWKRAAALMLSLCLAAGSAGAVSVISSGKPVVFSDAQPYLAEGGRVMLPLRAVGEALGCTVGWNSENRTARVLSPVYAAEQTDPDQWPWTQGAVYLQPGSAPFLFESIAGTTFTSDTPKTLLPTPQIPDLIARDHAGSPEHNWVLTADVPPVLEDGRIFLPIRAVAELCGFTLDWDSETQTVLIEPAGGLQETYLTKSNDPQTLSAVCAVLFPHGDNQTYE